MHPRRRLTTFAFAVALVAATSAVGMTAAASASTAGSGSRHPATVTTEVSPLDANGDLAAGYRIAYHHGDATCQSGSIYTGSAYRCYAPAAPAGLLDPCWVESDGEYVVCLSKPWSHKAVRLHVSAGWDNSAGFSTTDKPWGLQINNTRCLRSFATVTPVHGHTVTYHCNHDRLLAGGLDRGSPSWRIREYRRVHSHGKTHYVSKGRQHVRTAWYGAPSAPGGSGTDHPSGS
jgi:hypothetical protein